MAKASYSETPQSMINGWTLISRTPTLLFYRSGDTIVVAIRGTKPTDRRDVEADAKIALNQLESTPRYQTDLSTLLTFQKQYPPSQFEYYGVGHSLGGAILDSFLADGWIRSGISYNPAIQPKNIPKPSTNQRIYQTGDPLYAVMGQFAKGSEVRPRKKSSPFESLLRNVPYVGSLIGLYKDHQLDNFEGGTRRENVLKKLGLKEDGYSLEELSEKSGVPKATLQKVYNRGIGAYKTNPTSVRMKGSFKKNVDAPLSKKLSKEQWAMSRIYSFLDKNPKHDTDLRGGKNRAVGTFSRLVRSLQRNEDVSDELYKLFRGKDAFSESFRDFVIEWADDNDLTTEEVFDSPANSLAMLTEALAEAETRGGGKTSFLSEIGMSPSSYLREARRKAKKEGYDPRKLTFAKDGTHKLEMKDEKGQSVKFGAVGYKDHLMWSHLETKGEVSKGVAEAKRQRFQTSHRAMKGDWKSNPYSANWLALRILW